MQKFNIMSASIKKILFLLLFSVFFISAKANDGAFYSNGNQLIPIVETDIRVQKEVLKINRIVQKTEDWDQNYFEVSVYYEFFNPSAEKDLIVGFEAAPPYNAGLFERFPDHPYIFNFKAVMNGEELPYEVAHVPYPKDEDGYVTSYEEGNYYKDGRFIDLTKKQCEELSYDEENDFFNEGMFYYVYHFNAHFNKGLNIIQHTYRFDGGADVMTEYKFMYILTAANRWANNGIDDFTLEIDMGDRESFAITPTFFKGINEWSFTGKGKASLAKLDYYDYDPDQEKRPVFHVQEGSVVFHKKNFHPDGELRLIKPNAYALGEATDPFATMYLSLNGLCYDLASSDLTDEYMRILKNLPFAYRGYIFKTKSLQKYFESTQWYIPNPEFKGTMDGMSHREHQWVNYWSK